MQLKRSRLWSTLLCRIGWHRQIGTTVASYIRCYACGMDYNEQTGKWMAHGEFLETTFYQARCEQSGFKS